MNPSIKRTQTPVIHWNKMFEDNGMPVEGYYIKWSSEVGAYEVRKQDSRTVLFTDTSGYASFYWVLGEVAKELDSKGSVESTKIYKQFIGDNDAPSTKV